MKFEDLNTGDRAEGLLLQKATAVHVALEEFADLLGKLVLATPTQRVMLRGLARMHKLMKVEISEEVTREMLLVLMVTELMVELESLIGHCQLAEVENKGGDEGGRG